MQNIIFLPICLALKQVIIHVNPLFALNVVVLKPIFITRDDIFRTFSNDDTHITICCAKRKLFITQTKS